LLRVQFPEAVFLDLLDHDTYLRLQQQPTSLREWLPAKGLVVIDEIQRIPELLNEVHLQIEKNRALRFVLTGSSARKLRQKGVNLLGGRARSRTLHSLVWAELKEDFQLSRALLYGTLPSIFLSDRPREDLKSYVGDYLREEISAEAATRNFPAFARFLDVAALTNGQILNYQKIGNDAQVKRSTVQNYYDLLRDTLIGSDLPAFKKTKSRKASSTSKFYFFDLGLVNYLKGVKELPDRTPLWGEAFEAFIHHELTSWIDYQGDGSLHFWRSMSGAYEVDFLLNEEIAIECKASRSVTNADLAGLKALSEDLRLKRRIVVCQESHRRTVDGIEIVPWAEFLETLWTARA
jgi:predicted AAA+ superfamily ATPase